MHLNDKLLNIKIKIFRRSKKKIKVKETKILQNSEEVAHFKKKKLNLNTYLTSKN